MKSAETLRHEAEVRLAARGPATLAPSLHELQVHQVELEMQNEELQRAQAELNASQARYFDLYDLAPVGYLTLNETGLILEVNLTAATLLGVVRSALENKPIHRFIVAGDQEVFYRCRQRLVASGEPQACEVRLRKADGALMWAQLTVTANQECGGCLGIRVVLSDIHARKQAAEALQANRDYLQAVLDATTDAIFVEDPDSGRILDVNRRMCEMYGYSHEEVVVMNVADLGQGEPPYARADVFGWYQKVRRDGPQTFEWLAKRKNGECFWVEVCLRFTTLGVAPRIVATVRDLSAQKFAEETQLFLARTSSGTEDEPFFHSLARYLACSLGMDFVCIDRLEGDNLTARTVAVWCDGRFEDNVSYALQDTPCGEVVGRAMCCYPAGVRALFPQDQVLQDLRAESYVGTTLWSHTGQAIGLIALIKRVPLANRSQVETTLRVVAERASGELERLEVEEALRDAEWKFRALFEKGPIGVAYHRMIYDAADQPVDYFFLDANASYCALTGVDPRGKTATQAFPGIEHDPFDWIATFGKVARGGGQIRFEQHLQTNDRWYDCVAYQYKPDQFVAAFIDITERKRLEAALEKRVVALTLPLDQPEGITFDDLFDLATIQRIQDEFAAATGVASLITRVDGTPLTRPSNFHRLCGEIIRCTETGRRNCYMSDALLGRVHPEGPVLQPCLSGGLWDAGASIMVGDRHIANWLVGQVRDETQSEDKMRGYARLIGADEETFMAAYREIPVMSQERFKQIAKVLFSLAKQLSTAAYQNIQQARFISERNQAAAALQASLREKDSLLKEVHHRVKNNLQIISSLLRLQSDRIEQAEARAVLLDMQNRVRSMALIHEHLYRSEDLSAVDLSAYLRSLCGQLLRALEATPDTIALTLNLAPIHLGIDQAIPCGMLVSELVSNSLKHAFPQGRRGELRIDLQPLASGPGWRLQVADDGVGLPAGFALSHLNSLGMQLISDLARQMGGKLEIGSGPGAVFTIEFKARGA